MSQLHHDAQALKELFPRAKVIRQHGGSKDPWGIEFETSKGRRVLAKHNQKQDSPQDAFNFVPEIIGLKLPVITYYGGVFYFYPFEKVHGTVFRDDGHRLNYTMSEDATRIERELVKQFGAVRI